MKSGPIDDEDSSLVDSEEEDDAGAESRNFSLDGDNVDGELRYSSGGERWEKEEASSWATM